MWKIAFVSLLAVGCMVELNEGDGVAEATAALTASNAAYANAAYANAAYGNSSLDSSYQNGYGIDVSANWQKPWARVSTNAISNGFSIAFTEGFGAVFATAGWTANDPAQVSWVDGSSNACAHSVMRTGVKLANTCNPLVAKVCAADSYCCATAWDSRCTQEAWDLENKANPYHSVLVTGSGLLDSVNACVATVNSQRSSCRTSWDDSCVDLAAIHCYSRYVTRPRVEAGKLVADACVEAIREGAICPLAGGGPNGNECCRRSLVLTGAYFVHEFDDPDPTLHGSGRKVEWANWHWVQTRSARWVKVNATMIPDPCTGPLYTLGAYTYRRCGPAHHLWQLAGSGPLYPDCVGTAEAVGSSMCSRLDDQHGPDTHVRDVLVNTQAALINTSGHYTVDLRYAVPIQSVWGDSPRPGLLPPDPAFDTSKTEAVWDAYKISNATSGVRQYRTIGYPICRAQNAQRLDTSMNLVPVCATPASGGTTTTIRTLWR